MALNCLNKFLNTLSLISPNIRRSFIQNSCYLLYSKLEIRTDSSRNYTACLRDDRNSECSSKLLKIQRATCQKTQIQRAKSGKRKAVISSEQDSDMSDTEDDEDDESLDDIEPDYDAPLNYKHRLLNSHRADAVAAKGLSLSKSEADDKFYKSKLLVRGKTLLKKAQKLNVGDYVDVVHEEINGKLKVQRVKVIKIFGTLSKKGKPKVAVRVWTKPFEIDNPNT